MSKKVNSYDANIHLKKLKDQSESMRELLYRADDFDHIDVNRKLAICCDRATVNSNNQIDQNKYSCCLFFCPICEATKIRRECAIAINVVKKMTNGRILVDGKKVKPILRSLTLTLPKDSVCNFENNLVNIKDYFKKFLCTDIENKDTDNIQNFSDTLLSYAVYYHLSFSNDCHGNFHVGIHLHATLLLRPSFKSDNRITKAMVSQLWIDVTGSNVSLSTKIKKLPLTEKDFTRWHAYGLHKFDFDEAIANPDKFIAIMPFIKHKRFNSYSKILKKYRRHVRTKHAFDSKKAKQKEIREESASREDAYEVVKKD